VEEEFRNQRRGRTGRGHGKGGERGSIAFIPSGRVTDNPAVNISPTYY
jgi:hypothetical protein